MFYIFRLLVPTNRMRIVMQIQSLENITQNALNHYNSHNDILWKLTNS